MSHRPFARMAEDGFRHAITSTPGSVRMDSLPTAPPGIQLVRLIRKKPYSEIWEARQAGLERPVLLKWVDHTNSERFQAEANSLARLHNPGIVQIFQCGTHEGRPFLVLDCLPGGNLSEKLKMEQPAPWPINQAVDFTIQLARILSHAHEKKILHQDIKPSNILFDERGNPVLADFGLAREVDEPAEPGGVGSPPWMAPEQARCEKDKIGIATDIYGLGAILYQLITGYPPNHSSSPLMSLVKARDGYVESPRLANPAVPKFLSTLVMKALAPNPDDRFATAEDFARNLEGFKTKAQGKKNLAVAGLFVGLLFLGVFLFSLWKFLGRHSGAATGQPPAGLACTRLDIFLRHQKDPMGWLKLPSPGTLPVGSGDLWFVDAELNQPGYIYLFLIQSDGKVRPLFPWSRDGSGLGKISMEDFPKHPGLTHSLSWPPSDKDDDGMIVRKALRFDKQPGVETLLLLASKEPWPLDKTPADLFAGKLIPPRKIASADTEYYILGADQGRPVQLFHPETTRGVDDLPVEVRDPMENLLEKFASHFPVRRLVWFSHSE